MALAVAWLAWRTCGGRRKGARGTGAPPAGGRGEAAEGDVVGGWDGDSGGLEELVGALGQGDRVWRRLGGGRDQVEAGIVRPRDDAPPPPYAPGTREGLPPPWEDPPSYHQ